MRNMGKNCSINSTKCFHLRFGIKPIYYALMGDSLIFASEMKALPLETGISREIDKETLAEFYCFLISLNLRPRLTELRSCREQATLNIRSYWHVALETPTIDTPYAQIAAAAT